MHPDAKSLRNMVRPERVELPTFWFVARRSIQLSYGRTVAFPLYCNDLRHNCNFSFLGKTRCIRCN
jgi:hypothetical protein